MKHTARLHLNIRRVLLLLIASCAASAETTDVRELYETACSQCHNLAAIEHTRNGRAGWEDTVHKMVLVGAQLSVEEMEQLVDYLYRQRGPDREQPMRTGLLPYDSPLQTDGSVSSENVVLPEGEGKQLVEAYCVMCHDLGPVVATRRKQSAWQGYVENMLARNSMQMGTAQMDILVAYLREHFGKPDSH